MRAAVLEAGPRTPMSKMYKIIGGGTTNEVMSLVEFGTKHRSYWH